MKYNDAPVQEPAILRRIALIFALVLAGSCAHAQVPGGRAGDLTFVLSSQTSHTLSLAALAALPQLTRTVRLHSGHGDATAEWSGPSLWDALVAGGCVNPAQVQDQVRRVVRIIGADGYDVVLALAEISPEFAGHPVLLALRQNGRPVAGTGLRLIVPDEQRAGRSVRDVVRIEVR